MANKKLLDEIWFKMQDEPIAIKNFSREFKKRATKQKISKKLIKDYLKNW